MNKQSGEASSGGIGVLGLLGVIFVTLKVLEVPPVSEWSWWWVTAPFWGGFAFVLLIIVVVFGVGGVATLIKTLLAWRKDLNR